MPKDKDFKRLIRERMATTGERYTVARRAIERPSTTTMAAPASDEEVLRWVARLASKDFWPAFFRLQDLPGERLRPAAISGLGHEDWRVRRRCGQLLDDLVLTDESIRALTARLDDPHPRVRQAALHSLACVHCKPDGCALDMRPLCERMAGDPSVKVRAAAVAPLTWNQDFVQPWVIALLEDVAANDPSPNLRKDARGGLARIERQRATDATRQGLPDDLRRKTERHPGKWVAIAGGRIVNAQRLPGQLRKHTRGSGHSDAEVYWVAPESVASPTLSA